MSQATRIIDTLQPHVSPARLQRMQDVCAGRRKGLAVVLEGLQDIHNVSACIRTCEAFGIHNVHVIHRWREAVPDTASKGSLRWLDVRFHRTTGDFLDFVQRLDKARLLATALSDSSLDLMTLPPISSTRNDDNNKERPVTLLAMGNETRGCSKLLLDHSTHVRIPMSGFVQSLNVSVAMAVSLTHLAPPSPHGDLSHAEQQNLLAEWLIKDVRSSWEILDRAGLRPHDL